AMIAVQGLRNVRPELRLERGPEVSAEMGLGDRGHSLVRQVDNPRCVVKSLRRDLARSLVALQLDDDEIAGRVHAEKIDQTAEVGLDLTPDHEQRRIKNRDVDREPLLQA